MRPLTELSRLSAADAARRLLGCELVRQLDGQEIRVKIVETEAYDQTDAASHSHRGRTPRTDVMFGPAGHLYVYFTYGMHYCCNVVVGAEGEGAAVLIRACEPLTGEALMSRRRRQTGVAVSNGPAKICQALEIDRSLNGYDLSQPPLTLILQPPVAAQAITTTTRIGIKKAIDMPWRFYLTDNPFVSRL